MDQIICVKFRKGTTEKKPCVEPTVLWSLFLKEESLKVTCRGALFWQMELEPKEMIKMEKKNSASFWDFIYFQLSTGASNLRGLICVFIIISLW